MYLIATCFFESYFKQNLSSIILILGGNFPVSEGEISWGNPFGGNFPPAILPITAWECEFDVQGFRKWKDSEVGHQFFRGWIRQTGLYLPFHTFGKLA